MKVDSDFPRLVVDLAAEALRVERLQNISENLKSAGGGGTSGGMEALIDAKVAAAEARTDAKFAAVLTKLDSLTFEVRSTRSSIWTAAFAIMGLIIAVVAIVATIVPFAFGAGSQFRDLAHDEVRAVRPQPIAAPPSTVVPSAKPAK